MPSARVRHRYPVARVWLTLAVCAGALGAGAQPADALTQAQADAVAMHALAPEQQPSSVALFGLAAPLPAGARIESYSITGRAHARPPTLRLHARAWLFWMDLAYGAEFSHPSVLLVVDDRTGAVRWRDNLDMYPLVDGRAPPFVAPTAYRSGEGMLYATVPITAPSVRAAAASAADRPVPPTTARAATAGPPITKQDLKGECLVTIGDRGPKEKGNNLGDGDLANNLEAMEAWARSVGLANYPSPSDGPGLIRTVARSVTQHDCKDILIYITGHGMAPPPEENREVHLGNHPLSYPSGKTPSTGPPQIQMTANSAAPGGTVSATYLTPAGVEDAIETIVDGKNFVDEKGKEIHVAKHPDVHFKIKIDSCFAERFALDLQKEFKIGTAKADPKNAVQIIEYSSSSWEPSLQYMPTWLAEGRKLLRNPTTNPNEISEFTNGNIRGLETWTREPEAEKPRTLAAGLAQAFTAGASQDWSRVVEEPPLTHPGAIGPGLKLGTPDELTKDKLTGHVREVRSGASGIEEPPSGTGIGTTTGPVTVTEGEH